GDTDSGPREPSPTLPPLFPCLHNEFDVPTAIGQTPHFLYDARSARNPGRRSAAGLAVRRADRADRPWLRCRPLAPDHPAQPVHHLRQWLVAGGQRRLDHSFRTRARLCGRRLDGHHSADARPSALAAAGVCQRTDRPGAGPGQRHLPHRLRSREPGRRRNRIPPLWLPALRLAAGLLHRGRPDPGARSGSLEPPIWSIAAIVLLPATLIAGCEAGTSILPT